MVWHFTICRLQEWEFTNPRNWYWKLAKIDSKQNHLFAHVKKPWIFLSPNNLKLPAWLILIPRNSLTWTTLKFCLCIHEMWIAKKYEINPNWTINLHTPKNINFKISTTSHAHNLCLKTLTNTNHTSIGFHMSTIWIFEKIIPMNSKIIFKINLFLLFGYRMYSVWKSFGHRGQCASCMILSKLFDK